MAMINTFQFNVNLQNNLFSIVEASLSPVKYCLFQILGGHLILWVSGPTSLPENSSTSEFAAIGALGGTGLAAFYLLLILLRRNKISEDPSSLGTISAGSSIILKETVYSAVASIIGAYVRGRTDLHDQFMIAIAGALGPVMFLVVMFGSLGLFIALAWSSRRCVRWWGRTGFM